jgi:hypothetical protein
VQCLVRYQNLIRSQSLLDSQAALSRRSPEVRGGSAKHLLQVLRPQEPPCCEDHKECLCHGALSDGKEWTALSYMVSITKIETGFRILLAGCVWIRKYVGSGGC